MTAFTVSHPLCMLYLTQKQIQFSLFFSISKYGCVFYMRHLLYFYIECIAFLGRVVALMTLLRAIVRQPPPAEPKPLVSHCGISYDGFLLMQKLGAPPIFFKPKYHQRQQPKITTSPFKKKGHEKTG